MNYHFLKQLLDYAENFERDVSAPEQQTVASFATWLLNQAAQPVHNTQQEGAFGQVLPDTLISIMVSYLYRYARLYSKKVIDASPLTTLDDFTYLVILLRKGDLPTKTDLIERNIHEKTTGTEVLRRLLAHGLIEQFDDPNDRRSKRLKLTDRGRAVMLDLMPRMSQVATLVGGNLTDTEKTQLVYLLTKLHQFHNPIFLDERNEPIEKLLEHVTPKK
ncbi:DNA-binding MarR family transcriptional regulator [Larkinella arboricola]|uniref:DNA-binding MarR family transcriptional regulator n=1 Tax=Larkinella arboricola TaxID=643671 RepID=A0A327WQI1_LARAB|nr:MarR family winged helix-turn-helix transcriptional regulator [Larkinella arboricola]RAJ93102.1 DNA-binding MarR family transcriptional regulator [Larkinella arboricola]